MLNKTDFNLFLDGIEQIYPNASCELNYSNIYELLVAVMLSAQTTDKAVNNVTPKLFEKYPTPSLLKEAKYNDVYEIIKHLGLAKTKTTHLLEMAKILVDKFNSIVPNNMEELVTLPGVGRKTASVILVEGYKIPAMPVDTHIERICKRINLVNSDASVLQCEKAICESIPKDRYHKAHHLMIIFGRYFCKAINPNCTNCFFNNKCNFNSKK